MYFVQYLAHHGGRIGAGFVVHERVAHGVGQQLAGQSAVQVEWGGCFEFRLKRRSVYTNQYIETNVDMRVQQR